MFVKLEPMPKEGNDCVAITLNEFLLIKARPPSFPPAIIILYLLEITFVELISSVFLYIVKRLNFSLN